MQYACLDELETWLSSYLNFEKLPQKNIFWLDTMAFLCGKLKNPQNAAPAFHVAGSKGKGSVSAMIASILDEAGYSTGLYTSPHILDFAELIGSARGIFSEKVYADAAELLKKTVSAIPASELPGGRNITWFELVTLYAFLCFRQAKTDYTVLEVGLGGRLDATNVVMPKVACITPIELEHTEFLGDTIEKIATEKGGIIKSGVPVVIAGQTDGAKATLKQIARERGATVYAVDELTQIETEFPAERADKISRCIQNQTGQKNNRLFFNTSSDSFDTSQKSEMAQNAAPSADNFYTMRTTIRSPLFARSLTARLRLLGNFQAENAAAAAMAVKIALPELDERVIEKGLEKTTLPGRFEIVPLTSPEDKQTVVILDGAHTVNSVTCALQTFRAVFGKTDAHLLFACAADKDIKDIAPLFSGIFSRVTLTRPGAVKQSNLSALTAAFGAAGIRFTSSEDFTAAIADALDAAKSAGAPLLVTGSFYLLAEVKKMLKSISGTNAA